MALFRFVAVSLIAAGAAWSQFYNSPTGLVEFGARVFQTDCATCHGAEGNAVQGIDFARGRFKRVASDEDLARTVRGGVPGTAMPPFDLQPQPLAALLTYLRSMRESAAHPAATGDAARGQAVFEGKGGCLNCHRINGNGSRLGPDLSEIGAIRSAASLEQSIVDPEAIVLAEHYFCRAVTRDGVTITGRRLNEDPNTVQLIDTRERLISLDKSELREYALLKNSTMPSYREKLTRDEIIDLVKFLTTRRGMDGQ